MAHSNLGIALRDLGRKEEALEHFRSAVELDPTFAPAQTNLGQTLLDWARPTRLYRTARRRCASIRTRPCCTTTWATRCGSSSGWSMPRSRIWKPAAGPEAGLSNAHLGLVLQKEGQLSDALVWLKKAVELEPANAEFWQWLAELLRRDGRVGRVDSLLGAGRRSRSGSAIGRICRWAGRCRTKSRFAEAREHYDAAIQLQPDFAAAYLNLGGLQEELGDMAAAEASFRTALEKQPAYRAAARSAGDLAALQAARIRPGRPGRALEG